MFREGGCRSEDKEKDSPLQRDRRLVSSTLRHPYSTAKPENRRKSPRSRNLEGSGKVGGGEPKSLLCS